MRCKRVRDNLIAYASQELLPDAADEIRRHLAGCPSCRRELQSASAASEALFLLGNEEEAPELIGQVRARLSQPQPRVHSASGLRIAAASSLALLIVIAGTTWFLREPTKQRIVHVAQRPLKTTSIPRRAVAPRKQVETVPDITGSNTLVHPQAPRLVRRPVEQKPVMVAQLPPEAAPTHGFGLNLGKTEVLNPQLKGQMREGAPPECDGVPVEQQSGIKEGAADGQRLDLHAHNWQDVPSLGDIPELGDIPKSEGSRGLTYGKTYQFYSQGDGDLAAYVPDQSQQQTLKELQAAKLGQAALFISSISKGKCRLLIAQGASAAPPGNVIRLSDWGDLPLISAYRVYSPVKAKLKGVGDCTILGAVSLLVPAVSPKAQANQSAHNWRQQSEQGVYLIAYKASGSNEEKETGTILLIDVSVDGEGRPQFKEALAIPAQRSTTYGNSLGKIWIGVNVQFTEGVAGRATVTIALNEPDSRFRSYTFQIDLQVMTFTVPDNWKDVPQLDAVPTPSEWRNWRIG